MPKNYGHKVIFLKPIFDLLPDVFACTDPDLKFSDKMPKDFLSQLRAATEEYRTFKAGLALTLREPIRDLTYEVVKRKTLRYEKAYSIIEWEKQFWRHRVVSSRNLEIYAAKVDTTFFVCNKKYFSGDLLDGMRVAGDFSCMHLPWYPDIDIMNSEDRCEYAGTKLKTSGVWIVK